MIVTQSDLKHTVQTNLPCNLDPEDCSLYGQVLMVADLEHAGLHTVLGCLHVYLLCVLEVRTEMHITPHFTELCQYDSSLFVMFPPFQRNGPGQRLL
jgi:hypothetical protein